MQLIFLQQSCYFDSIKQESPEQTPNERLKNWNYFCQSKKPDQFSCNRCFFLSTAIFFEFQSEEAADASEPFYAISNSFVFQSNLEKVIVEGFYFHLKAKHISLHRTKSFLF